MLKKTIEKKWKGVGKNLKQHKKIMDKHWDSIKEKEKKFSWKEHNKWLDSFRGTTVYSKVKDVNKY